MVKYLPWETGSGAPDILFAGVGKERHRIAAFYTPGMFVDELGITSADDLANTKLASASPELLAVAKRLVTLIDNGFLRESGWEEMTLEEKVASKQQSIYNEAIAAIKKANGE